MSSITPSRAQQPASQDLKQGNYAAAIQSFNARLATNQADQAAQAGLLQALSETGQYREAEQAAKKFLAASAAAPQTRFWLGEVYAATGRYAEAIAEFERAAQQQQQQGAGGKRTQVQLQADLRRAEVLNLTGQEERARPIFESLVGYYQTTEPKTAPELTVIARTLEHLERYKEASDFYLEAIAADDTYIEAHLGGGELFTSKYNYAEAAEFFADALKINPNSARAHLGIALNKRLEGGEGVQEALAQALKVNPNLVPAKTFSAHGDLEAERYDKAATGIDEALRINPNALDAHSLRAALYYLQDRTSDHEAAIKATLAINPRYGNLFDTLSEIATNTRRYAQAVEFSRRAVQLSPRLWQAHLNLGMNLMRTGRDREGQAATEAAFKGDPFNVWAKNTLDLLDVMKDYRETKRASFRIKAAPKESDVMSVYAGDLLEEAERTLTTKYRFKPQAPINVEIFENHEDFAVRALGLPGLGALGVCFGQVVALDSPSARPVGQFNWGSTLWHEYTHVITLQMTDYRIPRWFSEGLSVYEERRGRPGWGDDWSPVNLKALKDGRWFKIADLDNGFMRPRNPSDVPLAYFQASQICEFIVERYGFLAILDMLARYKAKAKTPEVIKEALKLTEAEFDRAFDQYVQAKARPLLQALELNSGSSTLAKLSKEAMLAMLQNQPNDFALNLRIATLYKTEGNAAQAITHFKRAAELFPYYTDDGNPYEQLAELYEARNDKAAAADALEGLVKQDENNLEAVKRLAQLRVGLNDRARALEAFQLAFYVNPFDPAMHSQAGALHLEGKEADKAVREYSAALALNPPNLSEANFNLARAYDASGKPTDAKRHVLRSLEAAPSYDKAQDLLLKLTGND